MIILLCLHSSNHTRVCENENKNNRQSCQQRAFTVIIVISSFRDYYDRHLASHIKLYEIGAHTCSCVAVWTRCRDFGNQRAERGKITLIVIIVFFFFFTIYRFLVSTYTKLLKYGEYFHGCHYHRIIIILVVDRLGRNIIYFVIRVHTNACIIEIYVNNRELAFVFRVRVCTSKLVTKTACTRINRKRRQQDALRKYNAYVFECKYMHTFIIYRYMCVWVYFLKSILW